jgi:hypothetical protein
MMFLPVICLALAGFIAWLAHHEESQALYMLSFALVIAALGTGLMSYLAYSIL